MFQNVVPIGKPHGIGYDCQIGTIKSIYLGNKVQVKC